MVFVASEHDSVYAFDADGVAPTLLWQKSFIDPANGITTVDTVNDIRCGNLVPEIGITGTPVISLENQALYVVSEVKDQNTGSYIIELHALELATGAEKAGSPVSISASVAANRRRQRWPRPCAVRRPARQSASGAAARKRHGLYRLRLELRRGPTTTDGCWPTMRSRSGQKAAFNPTPNGSAGGIWQSGNGPSASPFGRIFIGIGNGTFDGTTDYGDSFVKLDPCFVCLITSRPPTRLVLSQYGR